MPTIDRIKAIRNRTSGSTGSSTLAKIQNIRAQTMPTFKTLEEAQTYANTNNINAVNTGVKIPTLVQDTNKIQAPSAAEVLRDNYGKQLGENIKSNFLAGTAAMYDYGNALKNKIKLGLDVNNAIARNGALFSEEGAKQAITDWQKAEEQYNQNALEDLAKTQPVRDYQAEVQRGNKNYSGLAKGVLEGAGTVSNMIPALPFNSMGILANAGGNAYNKAIQEGATPEEALRYATTSGATEVGIETLSGGALNKLADIPGIANITKYTDNIANPILRGAANLTGDVVGEGAEEIVATVVDPLIARITYNPQAPIASMQEVWNSFTSSIIPTLMFGGINAGSTYIQNSVNQIANKQKAEIEKAQIPQEQKEILKKQVDEMAKVAEEEISTKTRKNIAPESSQIQETSVTNEVIPREGLNQKTANVAQNSANTQNMAQNEVANQEKATYNEAGGVEDGRTKYKLSELVERESQNIESTEKILKAQPKISEKNLTKEQKKTKDLAKQKYNKNIIYYDGKNVTAKGLTTKNNNIYIDKQAAEDYGSDFVLEHEMAEDMIFNHTDKTGAEFDKLIEEIQKSKSFTQMYKEYSESLTSQQKQDLVFKLDKVAKEILCDVNGGRNTTQSQDVTQRLKSQLGDELYNKIVSTLDKYEKQIYKSSEQQGSFLMPTAEQLNQPSQEMIEGAQALTLEDMGTKTRRFTETARNVPGMPEEYRKAVKNNPNSQYQPVSNQETLEKAAEIIANNENIEQDFMKNDLRFAEDTAVGELLIKKALEEGDFKKANDLTAELAIKLTNAGQVVQAAALIKRMTPAGMLLYGQKQLNNVSRTIRKENESFYNKLQEQGIINKDGTIELTEDESKQIVENMKKVEKMEDGREKDILVGKTMAIISNKIPSTALEKVASLRRSGLLLNLKTLSRNVGSNATMSGLEAFKDIPATALDALVSLATGQRTTKLPSIKAYLKGFGKGAKNAAQDVYLGIDTSSTKNGKYEINKKGKAFKRENTYKEILKLYKDGKTKEAIKATFKRLLSDYEDTSTFIVDGTDKPFWMGRFEAELKRQMDLAGLKYGEDLPTTEMLEIATEEADYTTFKNKTKTSEVFGGVKRVLNAGKPIGLADALGLTFTNVPGNISSKVVDYTIGNPKQMIKELYNLASKNGKFNQRKFVDGLARSITGTGAITLGALLIKEGILRGSNDDDEDIANMEQAMGLQENSINVSALKRYLKGEDATLQEGDEFYTFDWNQPFAATWIMGADIYKAIQNDENAVWAGVKSAVNQIADMSSISTVSKLFKGYSNEDLAQNVGTVILEFPASFIPTIFNNIGQYTDEYSRQTKDATSLVKTSINKILNKLPGARETLEKKVDTFGQDVIQYKDGNDFMSTFVDPGYSSTYKPTELQKELLDVYKETGKNSVFPTRVNNSITYQNESKKLTSKEITTYQKTTGQYAKKTMEAIINTPYYDTLDAEERASLFSKVVEESNFIGKASVGIETKDYIKYKEKQEKLENAGIPLVDYYNSWAAQKDIEGIPGPDGKTLSGSKSRLKKEAIDKATADLDKYQRRVLYEMFNIGESVW